MKAKNYKNPPIKSKLVPLACSCATENSPCTFVQNGGRNRKPRTLNPTANTPVRVQRYLCKTHNKSLTWIPNQLLPHIHYVAPIVNEHVSRYVDGFGIPVDESKPHPKTVRRWIKRLTKNLFKLPTKVFKAMGIKDPKKEAYKQLTPYETKIKRLQVWGLLKTFSLMAHENRVPYHYAYGFT